MTGYNLFTSKRDMRVFVSLVFDLFDLFAPKMDKLLFSVSFKKGLGGRYSCEARS